MASDPNLVLFAALTAGTGYVPYWSDATHMSTFTTTSYTRSVMAHADANELRPSLELPEVNVKDDPYLAKGDGTTDDTAAIQAAITAGAGGVIFIPAGSYKVTDTLVIPEKTTLRGAGRGSTELLFYNTDADGIQLGNSASAITFLRLQGIEIDMTNSTGTSSGLRIYPNTYESVVEDVYIHHAPSHGIHVVTDDPINGSSYRMHYLNLLISNCTGNGVHLDGVTLSDAVTSQTFTNVQIYNCDGYGIYSDYCTGIVFDGFVSEGNTSGGIYLYNPGAHYFRGYGCEGGSGYGFTWLHPQTTRYPVICECALGGGAGTINPAGARPTNWARSGSIPHFDGGISFRTALRKVGYDTGSTEISVNDNVVGATSGKMGYVQSVTLTGGTWVGGDAYGYFYIWGDTGNFTDEENIEVNAAVVAKVELDNGNNERRTYGPYWYYTDSAYLQEDMRGTLWALRTSTDASALFSVDASTGAAAFSGTVTNNAGSVVKNGSTSAGYLDFYEDSDVDATAFVRESVAIVDVTNSQIKDLADTAVTLVAAPGSGKWLEFCGASLWLDYGSEALAEPSSPDDLRVSYVNDAGAAASADIVASGFITATADTGAFTIPVSIAGTVATNLVNKALVLVNTGGDYTGNASNDTVIRVIVRYRVHSGLGL